MVRVLALQAAETPARVSHGAMTLLARCRETLRHSSTGNGKLAGYLRSPCFCAATAEQVGAQKHCPGRDDGQAPAPKWTTNVHHKALSLADGATIRNPGRNRRHEGRYGLNRNALSPLVAGAGFEPATFGL